MDPGVSTNKDEIPSCSTSNESSPAKDKLFDPSIDMLVNDFDDERTLEEEEALAAGEADDPSAELSNLEKESNMPLEELLARYGYDPKDNKSSESEEEEEQPSEQEQICEPKVVEERSPTPPRPSKLSLLYEPITEDIDDSKNLTSVSRISEDEEDGESNLDEEIHKFGGGVNSIMVGSDYQAQIPEGLIHYDQIPANDNEDKLIWNPYEICSHKVEEYLRKAHKIAKSSIPKGTELRDDEEALYLLQKSGYNTAEALKELEMRGPASPKILNENEAKWSEEECKNFESGVRSFGKDFLQIQQNKVQSRSVGELVQFYYLWKKTERHDVFANRCRLEKKKYSLHPGLTDFMDRFLEDQEKDSRSTFPTAAVGIPLDS